jgi:phage-related minor tail protein
MALDASIGVNLIGRDVSASSAIKGVGDTAKTTSESIKDAGAKAGVAFAAISAGALLAAKSAAEDEQQTSQLVNTLKNVTGATDAQVKSVEDYINKTTLATGIADDKLRPAFQRLVQSTKDVGEAQKLTNLAMEIATAKHIDVQDAANALAKAHDGNMGALKRLGVSLDASTIKSKDFGKAVEELGTQFKGSLEANAQTAAGKMEIMTNSLNEAKESIGYALLPALTSLTGVFQKIAPFIQEHADLLGKAVLVVGALTGAVMLAGAAVKAYETITKAMAIAQTLLNAVMSANPIGLVVIAIAALTAALILAYQHSETFRNIITGAFDAVKDAASAVAKAVSFAFNAALGGIKTEINAVIAMANLAIRALNSIHINIPSWIPGLGGKSFGIDLPTIPMLADGGIVTKPTLAMIGEAGAEAVVPLSKGGFGGGINVTVNVGGSVVQEQDLAVSVRDQIAILMRRRGLNPSILGV